MLSFALSAKSFNQLIQENKITYVAKYSSVETNKIEIEISNKSNQPQTVEIPSGYIFKSDNQDYQNYVVTQQFVINIPANKTHKELVKAFCCNATKGRPQNNMLFRHSDINDTKLKELCTQISKAQNPFSDHLVQSSIWAISNQHSPLPLLAEEDSEAEKNLKNTVFRITETTPTSFKNFDDYLNNDQNEPTNLQPQSTEKYKVSIAIELNFQTSEKAYITSGIYEENGAEIYNFFRNKPLLQGKHQLKAEWNSQQIPEKKTYIVKTFKNGEEISSRTLKM